MYDEYDIEERIRQMAQDGETQMVSAAVMPTTTDYLSGALQTGLALGTSYLSRRIDIDLQQRVASSQPAPQRTSNQRPVNDHAVALPGGLSFNLGGMLPLIVGGLVLLTAAFAFKRG